MTSPAPNEDEKDMRIPGKPRRHARALWAGFLAAFSALAIAISPTAAPPARAASSISQFPGIDACDAPSVAQMQAFWNGTPYWNIGIYIGGSMRACAQANLTSSWLQQVGPTGIGWHFMPVWVGPQAPCTSFGERFSADPATAYQQGRSEAVSAYRAAQGLGMDTPGMPIAYDLEWFDTSDSGCLAAAQQFVQGWVDQLHTPDAQLAGLYSSSCVAASFSALATPPDFVWGASWDGDPAAAHLPCVDAGAWTANQRHKQYQGSHDETWSGVTLNVDSDCSTGPVYPGVDVLGSSPCTGAGAAGAAVTVTSVLDMGLVTPRFGWLLTSDELRASDNGGRSFQAVPAPLPASPIRAAFFQSPRAGWVASYRAGTITIGRTTDGGRSWRISRLRPDGPVGAIRMSFGSTAAGGLLVQRVSSSNFSLASFYITGDGGRSWQRRPAPIFGQLTVRPGGRAWLSGGLGGAQLFSSADGGRHWRELSVRSTVSGSAAARPGALRLPAALTRSGRAEEIVIDPAGQPATIALPQAAYAVSFATRLNGWAAAIQRTCQAGKHGTCRAVWTLVVTGDGGQSWSALSTRPVV
jgi:hypothetical protein